MKETSKSQMKTQLFSKNEKLPEMKKEGDTGYDIYMPKAGALRPGMNVIDLEVGFEIPAGHLGLILPRSSMAKKGIMTPAPPIDENYRGSVTAYIFNCTGMAIDYRKNDRVVQLVVFKNATPEIVGSVLGTSNRGAGKEGTSGK